MGGITFSPSGNAAIQLFTKSMAHVYKDGKWDQVFNWLSKGKLGGKWVNPPAAPIQLIAP